MRNYKNYLLLLLMTSSFCSSFQEAYAEENNLVGKGTVEYEGSLPTNPVDPERPTEPVNPGPSPSTNGKLRFDFAPTLKWGTHSINYRKQLYYVQAQLFHNNSSIRGNYVQIADERPESTGWTLQVRQESQFFGQTNTDEKVELEGAVLSFDYGWANSAFTAEAPPKVTKDTINLTSIAETYPIAKAEVNEGRGTWTIAFGGTGANENEAKNTLKEKFDSDGNPLKDPDFENQQVFENEAISLMIPGETKTHPVTYQTTLTWILASLP